MSFFEQEERLFAEWIKHDEWIHQKEWTNMTGVPVNQVFCPDGLHFTGDESEPYYNEDGSSYQVMVEDNKQEELWKNAYLKPVFLCKDYNGIYYDENGILQYSSMDIRTETGSFCEKLYYRFYAKYMILLYGLSNYNPSTNTFPSLEEACIRDNYWKGDKGFFHSPVVRMNLKKIAGGSRCSDWVLNEFKNNDLDFITRQRDIYTGANVFICCHGGYKLNPIWDLMWDKNWFPDMKQYDPEDDCFWFSEKSKVVIISTPHMSARVSYKEFYRAIPVFERFLREHKGFLG
jgi:hypothetical protein